MVNAVSGPIEFADAARVPAPGDNVAIATRTLPAGTRIVIRQLVFEFSHAVLEGHRFAVFRINKGEPLLSWGLPFGLALRDIEPGEYVCNEKILRVLKDRVLDFKLPAAPNFLDYRLPFSLDAVRFRPGVQVSAPNQARTFLGFPRGDRRGVGTRNFIVVLGTNSRSGAFARALARRFHDVKTQFPNIDAVVPVDHTEGGGAGRPNNHDLTLKTLAGFMVNPNVGAVLCIDHGAELLSNRALRQFLTDHDYPAQSLLQDYFSIADSFETSLAAAERTISSWLPRVNESRRSEVPVSGLRLGLQCGGSDAFSGVSGNPLVGLLARDTVALGGSANLAETDELIGAESYVLSNVRDLATAQAFMEKVARFQQWAGLHGHSAEGNPSGGNMFRGLYNIAIKSIGAARKKDPATRLDYVIDFADLMTQPGFYFMDSPGNDLESIAGQVAAGCNMILFATGNGSITNFPFVPTIKIMTTTRRFDLVRDEMDFNAGRYQDGEPLEQLGREAFDYMLRIASGQPSAGEKAGHSQVQLWREWRQSPESRSQETLSSTTCTNQTEPSATANSAENNQSSIINHPFLPTAHHLHLAAEITHSTSIPRYALVLPTSLCSGQIALRIAEKLNGHRTELFDRAVALPHTEGCGNSGGESERLFMRTMAGYLAHPFITKALLLEHGCEKTHNDAFRKIIRSLNLPESDYGFKSVQLDGGIERVTEKALAWFHESPTAKVSHHRFSIGLHGRNLSRSLSIAFQLLASALAQSGASVVFSQNTGPGRKLQYGARIPCPEIFQMDCPTDDDIEIITGLAATGAQLLLAYEPELLLPANPLVPTLQIARLGLQHLENDVDLLVNEDDDPHSLANAFLQRIAEIRRGACTTAAERIGNVAFQITRGYEGISL